MTEQEKRDKLLDALTNICSEFGWVISIVSDEPPDSNNEAIAKGFIIGSEEFVAEAEILIYEKQEVSNFAMQENEDGIEGLVETNKEDKLKGKKLLH